MENRPREAKKKNKGRGCSPNRGGHAISSFNVIFFSSLNVFFFSSLNVFFLYKFLNINKKKKKK
ncbi:hypothetical protein HanRHA438_Chr15g0685071 [Helianthus annuus]|nr:hypothetical protein HanRHA438_Chr15g0685071 [Helianthus annuus]